MQPGPRNLITDVPGLLVGNAEDAGLKSGVTVLTSATPFAASVAVLGGAPGTRETDLLAPENSVGAVDALVLSGGSAFGLDAASGVSDALREAGRGFQVGPARVPLVPAAILFDLLNGGAKDWQTNPYPALGRAAFAAAAEEFRLGSAGAGTGALTGMLKGGLGSASFRLASGVTVGALVAANPVGSVTTPGERHFWAAPFEQGDEFGGLGPDPRAGLGTAFESRKMGSARANTTIAIVATDAALSKAECKRLAIAAHDGIARAVVPAHTPHDGDLVFSVSTGARPLPADDPMALFGIGHAAALCLARAIARAVYLAEPAPNDRLPCWRNGGA
ncbi:P1 family peptidase [Frigidibacter sp. ROC022]|uniref:P1 family peptidase n=1 Tax=Frigidibacter sp. ROC022 TaxID=2971796 RepID=UPI00215B1251|nr:P1 family peptidase [Frigidibacter sp. ROC022]MCR8726187.1 P1 family peptidase [Frigidibacter sp. ROC022]